MFDGINFKQHPPDNKTYDDQSREMKSIQVKKHNHELREKAITAQCGCNQVITVPACGCQSRRYTPYVVSLTVSPYPLPGAPNIPAGLSIASDNLLISGPVLAAGKLPFSGTVALEGALPACGAGSVQYGCGDVAVLTEVPLGFGPAYGSCGYGCNQFLI